MAAVAVLAAETGQGRRQPARPGPARGVAGRWVAAVLVAGLAGCGSDAGDAPEPLPPAPPAQTTLLTVPTSSGSAEVGTFEAQPGNLWIGGQCWGGELELHVEPLSVLPIPCDAPDGQPFQNQIVMRAPTEIRLSVVAADTVTWNLVVEQ